MNRIILSVACAVFLYSCNSDQPQETTTEEAAMRDTTFVTTLHSLPDPKAEAKAILDSVNMMVARGIRGEIQKDEVNRYIIH